MLDFDRWATGSQLHPREAGEQNYNNLDSSVQKNSNDVEFNIL